MESAAPRPVTLQINVAAGDLDLLPFTVPHQLRVFGAQADELLFTLDTHHSRASRYHTEDFAARLGKVSALLARLTRGHPKARVQRVDYSPRAVADVGRTFLGRDRVPGKAANGSPFYAYLFGLRHARNDLVLHLDADMLFGGGSQTWLAEAAHWLERRPDLLGCNPLPGPPRADGRLTTQDAPRVAAPYPAFLFDGVSTRVLLLDRRRISLPGGLAVPLERPGPRARLEAFLTAAPPVRALEDCLEALMRRNNLYRLDFLGESPGLWSLHPVHRTRALTGRMGEIIARVEAGDIPEGQRGDYNLNDSMLDLGETRTAAYRAGRAWMRLRNMGYGLLARLCGQAERL